MSPGAAAEEGLRQRLADDAELTTLLGDGVRVFPGWPADTRQVSDFPRLTFYLFGGAPRRPGFQRVRATLDLWAWPTGLQGGRPKVLEVDRRLLALFDEQHWTYDTHWIYSLAGGFRDFPAPPGAPLRRMREITMDVSPR